MRSRYRVLCLLRIPLFCFASFDACLTDPYKSMFQDTIKALPSSKAKVTKKVTLVSVLTTIDYRKLSDFRRSKLLLAVFGVATENIGIFGCFFGPPKISCHFWRLNSSRQKICTIFTGPPWANKNFIQFSPAHLGTPEITLLMAIFLVGLLKIIGPPKVGK
jgi:hypothetical protein